MTQAARAIVRAVAAAELEQDRRAAFCNARPQGGLVTCHRCARSWAAHELSPPFCPSQPKRPTDAMAMLLRAFLYAVTIGAPLTLIWSFLR